MKPVIFMHVEKSGGTSIHDALVASGRFTLHPHRYAWFRDMADEDIRGHTLFSAHLGRVDFDKIEHAVGEPYRFAVLREPKRRLISWYDFLRGAASSAINDDNRETIMRAKGRSFVAFLEATISEERANGTVSERSLDNIVVRICQPDGVSPPVGGLDQSHVDTAIAYLESFDRVGITSFLDETYDVLSRDLDLPHVPSLPRTRDRLMYGLTETTHDMIEPTPAEAAEIPLAADLTWADRKVYDHFRRRFIERHADLIAARREQLAERLVSAERELALAQRAAVAEEPLEKRSFAMSGLLFKRNRKPR